MIILKILSSSISLDILGNFFISKKTQFEQSQTKSQPILDVWSVLKLTDVWLITLMSTESLNRTSDVVETPRVNMDVLKQRLAVQQKKDRLKRTIIVSTICVSLGTLALLVN